MPSSPRKPLPAFLSDTPFRVAQGLSLGLTPSRMRGPDLLRPFHGVRVPRPAEPEATAEQGVRSHNLVPIRDPALTGRCEALLLTLPPTGVFSHLTAAHLWPLPLPPAVSAEPIHVSVQAPARAIRRPGVVGHQTADPLAGVVYRGGLPQVDPATLFCQLASQLSLHDLVAVGDALVHRPVFAEYDDERPWTTPSALRDRVDGYRGRGKRRALSAVDLIRPGAESRPESLLRLALVDAGLPEPEVNVDVVTSAGRLIGRADLLYRAWRVIVEYDGEQHRTSTHQYDRDLVRLDAFAEHGWRVIRVVGRSFFADRRGTADRVAAVLLSRGWRA